MSKARGIGSPICGRDEARRRESRAGSGGERVWETRLLCSMRERGIAEMGEVLFGMSPGVGIVLYGEE